MIDFIYIAFRFPLGVIYTILIVFVTLIQFVIESLFLLVTFPLAIAVIPRQKFSDSWYGTYPNSTRRMQNTLQTIWQWVFLKKSSETWKVHVWTVAYNGPQ